MSLVDAFMHDHLSPRIVRTDTLAAIEHAPIDVIIEMTPLDAQTAEPATAHIRAAIRRGAHCITANKGPVGLYGPELRQEAASAGVGLRYEATLMDCLPVLALRDGPFNFGDVVAFAAIPNSTSNFVLDAMAMGRSRTEALAEAQRLGIAEADPYLDLEGWDGAFTAAILAQKLFGRDVRASDVERVGLSAVGDHEPAEAAEAGERIRMVARCQGQKGRVRLAPERLPVGTFLGAVSGFSVALVIETRQMGRLEMSLFDPRPQQSAYAIVMDLLALNRGVVDGRLRSPVG